MASFWISEYTDTSVTIAISPDTTVPYYRIFIKETVTGVQVYDDKWINIRYQTYREYTGLTPGTQYTVNVAYSATGEGNSGTWIVGSNDAPVTFTTSGGSVPPDPGPGGTTYYGYMSYNLNGASGSYPYEQGTVSSNGGYYVFTMPAAPTYKGYSFQYWQVTAFGAAYTVAAGGTIDLPCYGATAPGTPYTAVAIWKEAGSGDLIKIDGVYHRAMIWNGTQWVPGYAEIYTASGWKQTTE